MKNRIGIAFTIWLITSSSIAEVSLDEIKEVESSILAQSVEHAASQWRGDYFLFTVESLTKRIDFLIVYEKDVFSHPQGHVFVVTKSRDGSNPIAIASRAMREADTHRLFYALDRSDVFSLGKEWLKEPFQEVVLGNKIVFKAKANYRGETVETSREKGASLPMDMVFDLLAQSIGSGLGAASW